MYIETNVSVNGTQKVRGACSWVYNRRAGHENLLGLTQHRCLCHSARLTSFSVRNGVDPTTDMHGLKASCIYLQYLLTSIW